MINEQHDQRKNTKIKLALTTTQQAPKANLE